MAQLIKMINFNNLNRIVAVSSSGGHWEQLMIISPAFQDHTVYYCTTGSGLAEKYSIKDHSLIPDFNRSKLKNSARCIRSLWSIIRAQRPSLIVSTGAAPGLIALLIGKILGIKTMWIDSIANSEKISLSGKIAKLFVDIHITQWRHLEDSKTKYLGSVV